MTRAAPLHRLRRVRHVNDDDGVRRARLADADELLALHREVGEGDALWVDAGARELLGGWEGRVGSVTRRARAGSRCHFRLL